MMPDQMKQIQNNIDNVNDDLSDVKLFKNRQEFVKHYTNLNKFKFEK